MHHNTPPCRSQTALPRNTSRCRHATPRLPCQNPWGRARTNQDCLAAPPRPHQPRHALPHRDCTATTNEDAPSRPCATTPRLANPNLDCLAGPRLAMPPHPRLAPPIHPSPTALPRKSRPAKPGLRFLLYNASKKGCQFLISTSGIQRLVYEPTAIHKHTCNRWKRRNCSNTHLH
jgi:hypothetical protein